jgi:hypothetical protein
MLSKSDKFVLCVPHGGLNDSLCQIELCWQYCEKNGRKLIIDLSNSGFMVGNFFDYFSLINEVKDVDVMSSHIVKYLNSMRCYPHEFKGKIHRISFLWNKESHMFYDLHTGRALTFDFSKKYYESVLIHEQCGGGSLSYNFFDRIEFNLQLKSIIKNRLEILPSNYISIHVRNTDYRTEYEYHLKSLIGELDGENILICSDDASVFGFVRSNFLRSNIFTLSEPMIFHNKPIHVKSNYDNDTTRRTATVNAFIDLMGMAFSKKLYTFKSVAGNRSGYSRLAQYLNENKNIYFRLIA